MSRSITQLHSKLSEKEASVVPEIQDSVHIIKNSGDFYVQKSFSKSIYVSTTTGMSKQRYQDLINARDIFLSR